MTNSFSEMLQRLKQARLLTFAKAFSLLLFFNSLPAAAFFPAEVPECTENCYVYSAISVLSPITYRKPEDACQQYATDFTNANVITLFLRYEFVNNFHTCFLRSTPTNGNPATEGVNYLRKTEIPPDPYICPSSATVLGKSCICNVGFDQNTSNNGCVAKSDPIGSINAELKNTGSPKDQNCSNPINGATGNKYQFESDYKAPEGIPLEFSRHYNSSLKKRGALGVGWRHSYERDFFASGTSIGSTAKVLRPDGTAFAFMKTVSGWSSDSDINHRLTDALINGQVEWQLLIADDNSTEIYDAAMRLQFIQYSNSRKVGISYDAQGRLSQVTDLLSARKLVFGYSDNPSLNTTLVRRVTDLGGRVYIYDYTQGDTLLRLVGYPLENSTNNWIFYEHFYNEPALTEGAELKGALTGVLEPSLPNRRISNYGYDASGRAVLSEHADGIDRYQLTYNANGTTDVTDPLGAVKTYSFAPVQGVLRQISQSQPAGSGCDASASSTGYDINGNVNSQTDFNGNLTLQTWDLGRNLLTQRVEASGTPLARTFSYEWHPHWRLPRQVAEPKKRVNYIYNGDMWEGAPVSCAPAGASIASGSGTRPAPLLCREVHQATGDASGAAGLAAATTGQPRAWSYTYNTAGQVLSEDGPRTDVLDVTSYAYYASTGSQYAVGDLETMTDAAGNTTRYFSYNREGRLEFMRDPNDVSKTNVWMQRGWLKSTTVGLETISFLRDTRGLVVSVTRGDGGVSRFDYDGARRVISAQDTALRTAYFSLDDLGNTLNTEWTNPDGSLAKRESAAFDALGRRQSTTETRDGQNFVTEYGYDANGNPRVVTDAKNQSTTTTFDALSRPTESVNAIGGSTLIKHDARDQLIEARMPNDAVTSFVIDGLGNVTQEVSSNRGTTVMTYDAAGNPVSITDARGVVQLRTYDALNRLTSISYTATGENTTYTWDIGENCIHGKGRLCTVTSENNVTRFQYYENGALYQESRLEGSSLVYRTNYTRASTGRIQNLRAPTGQLVYFVRDQDGQIQRINTLGEQGTDIALVSDVKTDAAGNTTSLVMGNSVTQARTFSEDGRVQVQAQQLPAGAEDPPPPGGGSGSSGSNDTDAPTLPEWGAILMGIALLSTARRRQQRKSAPAARRGPGVASTLAAFLTPLALTLCFLTVPKHTQAEEALTYDANGNVLTRTLPGGTTTFGYDPLDRLSSEAGPAKTQSITLDANDNRLADGEGTKTYNSNTDRIATINGQSVTLDAAGNTLQARGYTYTWNQAGQLKTVSQGATLLATYTYDHRGLRSRKVTTAAAPQGASSIVYHHDEAGRLLAETAATGAALLTYIWRNDTPQAIIVHGVSTRRVLYLEADHLGSPIAARNQAGRRVWKWESDAFGSTAPVEDPDGDGTKTTINLRFPGQYFDAESGLHYNWHRYYDPKLGRYISADPIGLEGGKNMFAYANTNPARFTDSRGLCPLPPCLIAAGMAIGGAFGGASAHLSGGNVVVGATIGAFAGGIGGVPAATIGTTLALGATSGFVGAFASPASVGELPSLKEMAFGIAGGGLAGASGSVIRAATASGFAGQSLSAFPGGVLDMVNSSNQRRSNQMKSSTQLMCSK